MFDDTLTAIWKRAAAGTPPLSRPELENLLRPVARWSGRTLESVAWIYLALLATAAALAGLNLPGYRGNPTMLTIESGLLAASLAGAAFSGFVAVGLRRIARADLPLVETVERRLAFQDRWFGLWLATGAVTPWLLSMALNTLIDNQDGSYRINQPLEFVLVTAAMIGITYVLLRVSLAPGVRAARAVLHDVRAEALDATAAIAGVRRRTRVLMAVGTALLVLGVLAGLWLWWQHS